MTPAVLMPVLIATVFAGGGPLHSRSAHEPVGPALGFTVEVQTQSGEMLASSVFGNLTVKLEPGTYRVVASLKPPHGERSCGSRIVTVRRPKRSHAKPTRVALSCSIR